MGIYDIIFYLFAVLTLVSGFFVVTSKNIVHAAFYLLFTFFGVAGLYVLLGADFIAVVQLMVYVGGILVLLLFGVMLTNKITSVNIRSGSLNVFAAAIGVGLFAGALVSVMITTGWKNFQLEVNDSSLQAIGNLLINEYVVIFELLGVLLLIAMIGAASIARREKE